VGSIRCGLVFQLKQAVSHLQCWTIIALCHASVLAFEVYLPDGAHCLTSLVLIVQVGAETIHAKETAFCQAAVKSWGHNKNIGWCPSLADSHSPW
jgi:hypothetical protein